MVRRAPKKLRGGWSALTKVVSFRKITLSGEDDGTVVRFICPTAAQRRQVGEIHDCKGSIDRANARGRSS
jgi:hypothetical protein